jgi:hypothetical protein
LPGYVLEVVMAEEVKPELCEGGWYEKPPTPHRATLACRIDKTGHPCGTFVCAAHLEEVVEKQCEWNEHECNFKPI